MSHSSHRTPRLRTLAVHGGTKPDPTMGAIAPSIVLSTNFAARYGQVGFSALGTSGEEVASAYAREGHPNARQLEERLALLEGAEDAIVFATGMAAITGLFLHMLDPGDHLLMSDIGYAGTAEFTRGFLKRKGIDVGFADMSDPDDVRSRLRPSTRLIYAETPCNPILKLVDIGLLADTAHGIGAELVVDSTLATPLLTQPLRLGADFVVHSLTKYLSGHGDALGGVVLGRRDEIRTLRAEIGVHLGATLSPFNAWLTLRGLETLPVRMMSCCQTAMEVARFLERHPAMKRVVYPGLDSHPQHELARRQMTSAGAMIALHVPDAEAFGRALGTHTSVVTFAVSLGLTRSVILYCDTADLQATTFQLDDEHLRRYRDWAGNGFFRLSIGMEDPQDLCEDLDRALVTASPP